MLNKDSQPPNVMPQTLIEKIVQRFSVGLKRGHFVKSGDVVMVAPQHLLTHDNTAAIIPKFERIGVEKIAHPRQLVFALDHNVQDRSEKNLKKYARIEAFAKEHGIDFYPAGRGIGHQIMCEEGYAWPGTLVVASDSHANMYGGLGCLGTPLTRTDAAAIWATGETWWEVPPVAKVTLKGKLPPGVTGKDIIITLCGVFNNDEVLNHAVEFVGEGVSSLSIEERLTIANMTTEWGTLAGVFPVDQAVIDWIRSRIPKAFGSDHSRFSEERIQQLGELQADPDAFYAKELQLDLSTVQPHVSGPNSVKKITLLSRMREKKVKIDKAYLVSCVNSRVEDLAQAASIVRGKKVAPGVEFYISAASSEVQKESERRGDWQVLLKAGARPLLSGCGPCIGLGVGTLKPGEVAISATNRNFKGRMGSPDADAYLASPAVVAASAIAGRIDMPGDLEVMPVDFEIKEHKTPPIRTEIALVKGFPKQMTGELVFCPQDNLNTDGIYPSKYTYEDLTPEQQAAVVMQNYDATFGEKITKGDILVGGFNFGMGSSREQAATALKYRGLQLVIAGSFSQTYRRNAFNNGFLTLVVPGLITHLKGRYGAEEHTIKTGLTATLDFQHSVLHVGDKRYKMAPLGRIPQELFVLGGLENWVKKKLRAQSSH